MTETHTSLKPGLKHSLAQTWIALPTWGRVLVSLVAAIALVKVVLPVVFGVLGLALGLASVLIFGVLPLVIVGVVVWKIVEALVKRPKA